MFINNIIFIETKILSTKLQLNDGKAQGRSEEIKDRGILKHKKAHSSIWPNKVNFVIKERS